MKDTQIYHIVRLLRPRQWLKNTSLFAGIFFAERILVFGELFRVAQGVVVFTIISSAVYIINDIVDAPRDAKHPIKKFRPIPNGDISMRQAILFVVILLTVGFLGALQINFFFFGVTLAYVTLQLLYSLWLKNIIVLDSLIVAAGFVLRVFAGALAVPLSISSWLVLATIGLSMLLAFGKRMSERTLMENSLNEDVKDIETRPILNKYPKSLLDNMLSTSASFTIITYSLFAFLVSPSVPSSNILSELLPSTLASPKWMMLTIPIVIYGVARYLYVIYEKKEGESPERVLLSDIPLLFTVGLWVFVTFVIYYIITV